MRSFRKSISLALLVVFATQTVTSPVLMAGNPFAKLKRLVEESKYKGTEPCTGQDCAIECLAENIDWLEHYIDEYGSVVAKQPDVWGEARLTKHRDEYERIMFRQLNQFESTINASISQGDSSFIAQAFALSNAVGGGGLPQLPDFADPGQLSGPDFDRFRVTGESAISLEPTVMLDQQARYLKHLHTIRRVNEGDDTSDSPGYSLNLVRIPVSVLPGKATRQGFGAEVTITAEPVLSDDLMPTTFRNLAINDVVDFMGLPLVRCTERLTEVNAALGEDSEAGTINSTLDAAAVLNSTVQELVAAYTKANASISPRINFVAYSTPAIRSVLRNTRATDSYRNTLIVLADEIEGRTEELTASTEAASIGVASNGGSGASELPAPVGNIADIQVDLNNLDPVYRRVAKDYVGRMSMQSNRGIRNTYSSESAEGPQRVVRFADAKGFGAKLLELAAAIDAKDSCEIAKLVFDIQVEYPDYASIPFRASEEVLRDFYSEAYEKAAGVALAPTGRARRAINPINPSSLEPVIGLENFALISKYFEKAYYGRYIRWNGGSKDSVCNEQRINLLDARRFLRAEIDAAYELLSSPKHVELFAKLAAPASQLAKQIRGVHFDYSSDEELPNVSQYRYFFFRQLHSDNHNQSQFLGGPTVVGNDVDLVQVIKLTSGNREAAKNSVEALAWAIVVEAALLNDRLNQDIRKLATAKEVYDLKTDRDFLFFLPDTVQTPGNGLEIWQTEFQLATEVFQRYVKARWPIHVFAIDPVTQDQNVADVSQRQRELQFALALGFMSGQIGINSLTQYSRELQTQIETVSLNRTVVGFGHGADTFGWRFYPRVQALDVPGTLGTIRETIMGANRDYDLKHRRIESGQRECVAIVLMPSFVPYADFDIRTNWFKLTNPKNSALTMKDSVRLSRAVTAMRSSKAQCSECQHLYRQGEVERLFKRIDQLDRELPLQSQRALIPYENTLGGFEMFNTGVTDLTPELIGWYGAPGINKDYNACGCYQGCNLATGGCSTSAECTALQARVATIEQRLANTDQIPESPIPACEGPGTTLFLVGDNFSVHDTKVIAGGICIPQTQLISRDIMRVTIPHCVKTVTLCENGTVNEYVSIYVATPYGVTNHLHVPVITSPDTLTVTQSRGNSVPMNASNVGPTQSVVNPTSVRVSNGNSPESLSVRRGVSRPNPGETSMREDCGCASQNTHGIRTEAPTETRVMTRTAVNTVSANQRIPSSQLSSLLQQGPEVPTEGLIEAVPLQSPVLEGLIESDGTTTRVLIPTAPVRTQVDVNVNYAEPHRMKSKLESAPILNRVKTEIGEHWRNLRDKLPAK